MLICIIVNLRNPYNTEIKGMPSLRRRTNFLKLQYLKQG